jgi:PAS domain S-box-containing protein
MAWYNEKTIKINRYLFAVVMIIVAAALRVWPLDSIGSKLAWLTFYPAVMIAGVYGGLYAGLLATLLACLTVIFMWPALVPAPFINNSGDWIGVAVFSITCTMMSGVAEALLRAKMRAEATAASQKESEARWRALFNTTAISIVVIDEKGRIEEFNPASEIIFSYAKEEVIGQNINILMPEPYSSQHDSYLKNYLATGTRKIIGFERELAGKRNGNTVFPLELLVDELNLGSRRVFVGFVKDITERKKLESASRYFEAIIHSSDDPIISKTMDGIVTSWNASAEKMFGYTAEEMIGSTMMQLFPSERLDEEKLMLEQIALGQRISHFETVRICKNDKPIEVSVTLSPIIDEVGNVIGVSKIVRDITQSKQLERALHEAKLAAENANRSKSEFLANMSHEIRTPMNAIIGLSRLAAETELTPKQQDYLQKIQVSSQALLGILNDVLDLSKIESGRMEIEHIEFDPTMMLQSVSDLFMAKAEETGLEIFLDIAPEIPLTVVGDPLRIQQILTNLVSNAIKFTPKGEIHIRMDLEESNDNDMLLQLTVRDTGIGISESVIERLFRPFTQADASTTRRFGGTGLGLVISKQLAELMGGSIKVSSQPGQGSTFSFSVRCGKGETYNWNQDSHHLKDTRVLVVDDQETSCIILKNILESWQFQVTTVLSAEEALQLIQQQEQSGSPFDLLLLDWQMEGMSGLELAQELERNELQGKLDHAPTIIMVTAYSKEQLLREVSVTSARLDAILTKPVVPSSLLNTILHVYHYNGHDYRIAHAHIDPYEAARPLRNTRILLVEDNMLNQQVASEFLEKAGLRITIANHGGEAVQWMQRENFDAVLMDLQMPEMDGYEATRHIRRLPGCGNLPIIAMTAAAMQHDRQACLDAGMNDHVAKPINPRELIDTLLRWVKPKVYPPVSPPSAASNREEWADLADQLPGFKLRDIMTMLGGNQEQLLRMLNAFKDQFAGEASIIASEIAEGNLDDVKKRLHNLNGAAGNLGAMALHQAGTRLHAQVVNGRYDAVSLNHWISIFNQTMNTIAAISAQSPAAESTSGEMFELQQVISELDALLANDSFIGDELLTRLKSLLADDKSPEYDILTRHILDTDYAKARSVLNALAGLPNDNA